MTRFPRGESMHKSTHSRRVLFDSLLTLNLRNRPSFGGVLKVRKYFWSTKSTKSTKKLKEYENCQAAPRRCSVSKSKRMNHWLGVFWKPLWRRKAPVLFQSSRDNLLRLNSSSPCFSSLFRRFFLTSWHINERAKNENSAKSCPLWLLQIHALASPPDAAITKAERKTELGKQLARYIDFVFEEENTKNALNIFRFRSAGLAIPFSEDFSIFGCFFHFLGFFPKLTIFWP